MMVCTSIRCLTKRNVGFGRLIKRARGGRGTSALAVAIVVATALALISTSVLCARDNHGAFGSLSHLIIL